MGCATILMLITIKTSFLDGFGWLGTPGTPQGAVGPLLRCGRDLCEEKCHGFLVLVLEKSHLL